MMSLDRARTLLDRSDVDEGRLRRVLECMYALAELESGVLNKNEHGKAPREVH